MSMSSVGVIGTGIMGAPMAMNLIDAGYDVHVTTRTRSKAEPVIAKSATWHDDSESVAAACGVVISIVSDSPDVEAVYLDERGVCAGLREGALCIDMSTISPEVAKRVAAEVAKRGGSFLDAPVSGGKTGAEAGTLAIMVGGHEADVARARPVLEAMGKSIVHCGPVGHGQLTKLCNQILCGLNLLATSEAILFAKRVGVDPSVMLEITSKGAAGSWALENLGSRMIARDFDPMFMIDLQQKDLRIALETAESADVSLLGTALVHQLLRANQAAGEGREGTQALLKTLERLTSVKT